MAEDSKRAETGAPKPKQESALRYVVRTLILGVIVGILMFLGHVLLAML